jgi:hypothetical protein
VTIWAWERPEDLRALPAGIGVAFLAQTLTLDRHGVAVSPRRQPLRVDPATALMAVTRIEAPAAGTSGDKGLTPSEVDRIADSVARTRELPRVSAIQIDFDATLSQRSFYRDLLHRVRGRIGSDYPLSITALASWCMDDYWLADLPVDEVVPMLFRMGPDWPPAKRQNALSFVTAPTCRGSVGLSLDEPLRLSTRGRRVYVFNPSSWNAASLAAIEPSR